MGDDRPILEVQVKHIDSVFVPLDHSQNVTVLLTLEGRHDLAISMPPAILAMLEAKLEMARDEQASHGLQQ